MQRCEGLWTAWHIFKRGPACQCTAPIEIGSWCRSDVDNMWQLLVCQKLCKIPWWFFRLLVVSWSPPECILQKPTVWEWKPIESLDGLTWSNIMWSPCGIWRDAQVVDLASYWTSTCGNHLMDPGWYLFQDPTVAICCDLLRHYATAASSAQLVRVPRELIIHIIDSWYEPNPSVHWDVWKFQLWTTKFLCGTFAPWRVPDSFWFGNSSWWADGCDMLQHSAHEQNSSHEGKSLGWRWREREREKRW